MAEKAHAQISHRWWHREWVVVLALSVVVAALRLPSLELPFDNDSGGHAYHARLITRGEPLYGTHHPGHHMPGVYYANALAFWLFGDSVWAVKFLLLMWIVVAAYLVYRLGVLIAGRAEGVLGAFLYALLSSHILLKGDTATTELFANLPRVAAVLLVLYLTVHRKAAWMYVFVGMACAAAVLFKVVYVSSLAIVGIVLLVDLWQSKWQAQAWRVAVRRGLWIAAGCAAILLPVIGYFALVGLLPRFLLIFTMGAGYVDDWQAKGLGPLSIVVYPLIGLFINNAVLLCLGLAGALMAVSDQVVRRFGRDPRALARGYVALWLCLSLVQAGVSQVLFVHYYQLVVPPLALMAAWFLLRAGRDILRRVRPARRQAAAGILVVLAVIAIGIGARQNFDQYYHYARYRLGLESHTDFVLRGGRGGHLGPTFLHVNELADYVRAHTSPSDRVYAWIGDIEFYYIVDRRSPIDILGPRYAGATGSYRRIFGPQTRYVIVGETLSADRPVWLDAELTKNYVLETVIHTYEVYGRTD